MWLATSINEIRENIKNPEPVIEDLKFRLTLHRYMKDEGIIPENKYKWKEALMYAVHDIFESIHGAYLIRESRKTWWQRWGKRALKLLEAGVIIVAGIYSKKLPI